MHNWIALSAETPGVLRDECGVPVEWTLLREGENPICQEGRDGSLRLSAEAMREIMALSRKDSCFSTAPLESTPPCHAAEIRRHRPARPCPRRRSAK